MDTLGEGYQIVAMEVKIQTLTPIWTGGIESGKCDRIHETGLLGSLRWWMEVLVRGMGGVVCDPTEQKCSYDSKKPNNGLCKVCEVFGATGWKRQFRLEVQEIEISDAQIKHTITADRTYTNDQGKLKTPTWYFRDSNPPNAPKNGTFIIKIQSFNPKFKPEIIAGLIQFIADWSALGARSQMGFGVIKIECAGIIDTQPLYDWLILTNGSESDRKLPSLQNIFLAKIHSKDSNFDERSTFDLKYDLRQLFRSDKNIRHFIMGTVKGDVIAAKVKISRPYKDENGNIVIRVWGYIPQQADIYNTIWNRETVVEKIHEHLKNNHNLTLWREINSGRDFETGKMIDEKAFLQSLLKL